MSLNPIISDKEGEFASLGKIIRTACILTKQNNKKTVTAREIQFAIRIHCKGEKLITAIKEATKTLTMFMADENASKTENFKKSHKKLKNLIILFGVDKMSKGVNSYLMGIFNDIPTYEFNEDEIAQIEKDIDIQDFLRCVANIKETQKLKIIKAECFNDAINILCPTKDINLIWSIGKSKENVEEFMKDITDNVKISKEFMNKIIYN